MNTNRRIVKRNHIFVSTFFVFFCFCLNILCSQTNIYFYYNSQGQKIVTGNLKSIPERYLDQVKATQIVKYSTVKSTSPLPVITTPQITTPQTTHSTDQALIVDESEYNECLCVASATSLIKQLKKIQLNNERMNAAIINLGTRHPTIRQFHFRTVTKMSQLSIPDIITPELHSWRKKAHNVVAQLKTLQYTTSRWLEQNSNSLRTQFPQYLLRIKMLISELENDLKKLEVQCDCLEHPID